MAWVGRELGRLTSQDGGGSDEVIKSDGGNRRPRKPAVGYHQRRKEEVMSHAVEITSVKQVWSKALLAPPYENMVWIPGGTFLMGSDKQSLLACDCETR
jgi:formylglycine-generating enzyme required for sulfatase activity